MIHSSQEINSEIEAYELRIQVLKLEMTTMEEESSKLRERVAKLKELLPKVIEIEEALAEVPVDSSVIYKERKPLPPIAGPVVITASSGSNGKQKKRLTLSAAIYEVLRRAEGRVVGLDRLAIECKDLGYSTTARAFVTHIKQTIRGMMDEGKYGIVYDEENCGWYIPGFEVALEDDQE